jgi:uncharacterized protein YneF (UPF0154 family)
MITKILYLISGLIILVGIIGGIMWLAIKLNDWLNDETVDL